MEILRIVHSPQNYRVILLDYRSGLTSRNKAGDCGDCGVSRTGERPTQQQRCLHRLTKPGQTPPLRQKPMFTGLVRRRPRHARPGPARSLTHAPTLSEQIEHIGTISAISALDTTQSGGGGWSLTISDAAAVLSDCHVGDSIAVNGCCLTVTEFDANSFKVGLAPETLSRTNLGARVRGTPPPFFLE
jgi:hypothetical protein